MSIRDHIRKLRGDGSGKPSVVVAAFGKHPGWDDHITDIGLGTDALSACKSWLYAEGIRSLLDDGVWDELDEDEVLPKYDHLFFQRTREGWLLGRMWSSTDGKGRSRYPMVVCVEGRFVDRDWMLDEAISAVESLRGQCIATTSADDVRHALRAEEVRLQNALIDRAASGDDESAIALRQDEQPIHAELAGQATLGPDHEGLHRVMYQLDRDMSAYQSASRESARNAAARHMRVPSGEGDAAVVMRRWMRLMERELADDAPVVMLLPVQSDEENDESSSAVSPSPREWMDVIIGTPTASHLKCLRCRPKAMPLVTDVPYQIDSAFIEQVERLIAGDESDEASTSDAGTTRAARANAPDNGKSSGSAGVMSSLDPRVVRIGGPLTAVLALALLAIGIVGMLRSGDPIPAELRKEYASLRESWAGAIITTRESDRERIDRFLSVHDADESLKRRVERAGRQYAVDMDHRSLAPDDAFADEGEMTAAIDTLRTIRAGLVALLEKPRARAQRIEQERHWSAAADQLRGYADDVEELLTARRRTVAAQNVPVERLVKLAAAVESVDSMDQPWRTLQQTKRRIRDWNNATANDPLIGQFTDVVQEELSAAPLDDLAKLLEQWNDVADMLADAAERWPQVDVAHLREQCDVYDEAGQLDRERFVAWRDAVESEQYALLPDDIDPRRQRQHELNEWRDRLWEMLSSYQRTCGEYDFPGKGAEGEAIAQEAASRFDKRYDELHAIEWDRTRQRRREIDSQIDELDRVVRADVDALASAVAACLRECDDRLADVLARGLPDAPLFVEPLIESLVMDAWLATTRAASDAECVATLNRAVNVREFASEVVDRVNRMDDVSRPRVDAASLPSAVSSSAVAQAFATIQNDFIRTIAERPRSIDWDEGVVADHAVWDELNGVLTAYEQWADEANRLLADYREIERRLDQCYGWTDDGGVSEADGIGAIVMRWHDADVRRELSEHMAALDDLDQAAAVLWWIEQGGSGEVGGAGSFPASGVAVEPAALPPLEPSSLISIALDADQKPAHRWAAWRRMGQFTDEEEFLEWERSLNRPIQSLLMEVEPPRRGELRELHESIRHDRWRYHAARAENSALIEQAFDVLDHLGVNVDDLDARMRLNFEIRSLRRTARRIVEMKHPDDASLVELEEQARAVQQRLVLYMETHQACDPSRELAESVRAMLEFVPDDRLKQGLEWSELGLAQHGWLAEPSDDDAVVRFYPPASWIDAHPDLLVNRPLVFRRVMTNEDGASYLATTELSVGLFIVTVEELGDWSTLRQRLMSDRYDEAGRDRRRGARVWRWKNSSDETSQIVINNGWFDPDREECYADGELADPPNPDHPMQYVSAAGAAYVSMLLGCRLMTEQEWRAAFKESGGEEQAAEANLRDVTWASHAEHTTTIDDCESPDRDIFLPRRPASTLFQWDVWNDLETGTRFDDDVLWFRPVVEQDHAAGRHNERFRDLVGNVWEFTYEESAIWDELTADMLGDQLPVLTAAQHQGNSSRLRVIGASAFSHPDLGFDEPVPVDGSTRAMQQKWFSTYADVGTRLAFSVSADEFGMDADRQFQRLVKDHLDRLTFVLAAVDSE